MTIMTNEEKTIQIVEQLRTNGEFADMFKAIQKGILEMAEWKDAKLKNYLEECIKHAENSRTPAIKRLFELMIIELGL